MRYAFLLICLLGANIGFSQIRIEGKISSDSGLPIQGANILVLEDSSGAVSDGNGRFILNFHATGGFTLSISHVQYLLKIYTVEVKKSDNLPLEIVLQEKTEVLDELEITNGQSELIAVNKVRINSIALQLTPVPFQDISGIIATLPSVTSNNELSSAYSVRGGSYDENLVLVNDIPVYRPFLVRSGQEEGLSFVNIDLITTVDFSAGGWSVAYDDKMSSVLSSTYKTPDKFGGSAMLSLLGAKAHVQGTIGNSITYLAGVRHKQSAYLLNTLSVEGDYKPSFTDFQTYWTAELSETSSLDVLLAYANNNYQVTPTNSSTSFGTFNQELRLDVAFDGSQKMKYNTYQAAIKYNQKLSSSLQWNTMISIANYYEGENIDLEGGYRLCDIDKNIGSDTFDECISLRGIGTLFNYSRNRLSALLIDTESSMTYNINTSQNITAGVGYSHQNFEDYLNEYELIDSAGYVSVESAILGEHNTAASLFKGFIQHGITIHQWYLLYGVRINHNTLNKSTLVSPRFLAEYNPLMNKNLSFNFALGIYQQQPFYKEYRNYDGSLLTNIPGQSSAHANLGIDYNITWWGRPFLLTTEIYYKYGWRQVPYIIENVRQQYFSEYQANTKSFGFEARLGGEFIPGTESWFSFGLMSAQEKIPEVDPEFIRRPTDQRFKLAFVFEDHIPNDPSLRVNLSFQYGSGLPVGPPNSLSQRNSFAGDAYTRLDIGFSKIFDFDQRFFDFLRLGAEINNLFGSRNAVSYTWITDVNNQQFAVPNYLTGRLFNVVVSVGF